MANFYEHYYQSPYDFNQVNNNLYDHYQQEEIAFDPTSYYNNYYNWNGSEYTDETSSASVAYSVSTMSESKHLFYDPNYYTTYESPPQFSIYCSVQGFNEPEFDDYDPTPYGGGYDIVATYGKPLPQSVETCYPSSTSAQAKPPSPPEIITPVPLGIYDGVEDKGEVKALYVPSGYGLEATDLCEVIFGGYFPCVLRNKRRQEDENRAADVVSCWESNDSDPWKTTSDYLFGDSYPYGYENRVERNQFEISSYGYRRY
ncbi:unnamed protein product [Arabis nemorensis]|uniref:Uncharacterized protein n=1 Tax=Arabis nemorensis TaxID=586526 RepID=A0A565APY5_9BRAS|nr:unnamed protein product [Arabis nemorensis]